MNTLDAADIEMPAGNMDRNGTVFFWQGEVYRASSPGREHLYRELIESSVIDRLFERGLVTQLDLNCVACRPQSRATTRAGAIRIVCHGMERLDVERRSPVDA